MRRASLVVAVLAVVLVGPFAVGRSVPTTARQGTPSAPAAGVVGVWRVTVSPPLGPPHAGLVTFAADGTLRVATQPVQPAPPEAAFVTVVFGEGHGVWAAADAGADFVVDFVGAGDTGEPFGTLTLRGRATVGPNGDALSGTYALSVAAPGGAAAAAGQGSFEGRRMTLEAGTPAGGTPTAGTPVA